LQHKSTYLLTYLISISRYFVNIVSIPYRNRKNNIDTRHCRNCIWPRFTTRPQRSPCRACRWPSSRRIGTCRRAVLFQFWCFSFSYGYSYNKPL